MAPSGSRGGWARCSRAGAYSAEWTTNAERTAALQRFLDRYNYHRVRHEAPYFRVEVRDLHRSVVAAAGSKLRAV
jgi:hypothetical protein